MPYLTTKGLAAYAMGHVKPFHGSRPLMNELASQVGSSGTKTFVETGTFRGDSLKWFAQHFPDVDCHTVDINPLYVLLARLRLRRLKNVHAHYGDSARFLKENLPRLQQPVLFWLDAHWLHESPLNDELKEIVNHCDSPLIFIDDWKGNYLTDKAPDLSTVPAVANDPAFEIRENESEHYCLIRRK